MDNQWLARMPKTECNILALVNWPIPIPQTAPQHGNFHRYRREAALPLRQRLMKVAVATTPTLLIRFSYEFGQRLGGYKLQSGTGWSRRLVMYDG